MRPAAAIAVLAGVLALLLSASRADTQLVPTTLDDNPISTPSLGMDAEGGAVIAWVGFQRTVSGDGRTTYVDAIKASVRPAGGTFGPSRALSALSNDVTRDVALAV